MSEIHREERNEEVSSLAEDVQSQQDQGPGRASSFAVEADINKDEVDDTEKERLCPICWLSEEAEDKFQGTSCSHFFHVNCLEEWLNQNTTCPMCRSTLRDSIREESPSQETFETVEINSGHVSINMDGVEVEGRSTAWSQVINGVALLFVFIVLLSYFCIVHQNYVMVSLMSIVIVILLVKVSLAVSGIPCFNM